MPDSIAVVALVLLLLPMFYFFLASPAFLLVTLDIRSVGLLLRGMFSGYLLAMTIAGAAGALAFTLEVRLGPAMAFALLSALAFYSRRWFLAQIDARLDEKEAGDADAVRRLRRLHVGGMLNNAVQLAAVVACIPYIVVMPG